MPLIIYFMLFTSWTFGNFTELHYNIAEDIVSIQVGPQICQKFAFSLMKGMCSCLVEVAVLPL
jgi:hypothetical protein